MDPSYSEIQTYNWLGDADIDYMYATYLGNMDDLQNESLCENFRQMEVSTWRGEECQEWAKSVLQSRGYSQEHLNLDGFRSISGDYLLHCDGRDLALLVGEHSQNYSQNYSQIFANSLQELRDPSFDGSDCLQSPGSESDPYLPQEGLLHLHEEPSYAAGGSYAGNPSDPHNYGVVGNPGILQAPNPEAPGSRLVQGSFGTGGSYGSLHDSIFGDSLQLADPPEEEPSLGSDDSSSRLEGDEAAVSFNNEYISPGIPSSASPLIEADDILHKIKASRPHRVRGLKNWEFLMRLLMHPKTNPSLIEWEDKHLGIFKLRKPDAIARLWASRNQCEADKGQGDLSYNNFARGLRHHYKKGTLIPIPERQLVYQCGQKALDFLEALRNQEIQGGRRRN